MRDLIAEMLDHDGATRAPQGEKWAVSKRDKQGKDKGEDSPTSYNAKPIG